MGNPCCTEQVVLCDLDVDSVIVDQFPCEILTGCEDINFQIFLSGPGEECLIINSSSCACFWLSGSIQLNPLFECLHVPGLVIPFVIPPFSCILSSEPGLVKHCDVGWDCWTVDAPSCTSSSQNAMMISWIASSLEILLFVNSSMSLMQSSLVLDDSQSPDS